MSPEAKLLHFDRIRELLSASRREFLQLTEEESTEFNKESPWCRDLDRLILQVEQESEALAESMTKQSTSQASRKVLAGQRELFPGATDHGEQYL